MTVVAETATMSVAEAVNKQIANWGVLYVKLHHYHWHVKGKQFFTLHEKFQQLYEEAAVQIDELAERVLAIKGKPVSTMKGMLELATVKEASGDESADVMVKTIMQDFRTMSSEAAKAMELAESAGDQSTADMLLGIQTSLEKHIWMLEATLG